MKLSLELTLGLLAVSCVDAFVVPPRTLWATKAALVSRSYRAHPVRRDTDFQSLSSLANGGSRRREAQKQGGGLMIGGLTLGGPGGGITGEGLKLGGNQKGNGTATAAEAPKSSATKGEKPSDAKEGKPAAEGEKPAATEEQKPKESEAGAGAGTENQPGRAEGESAKKEAEKQAQEAKGEKSNGVKATEESEKFSEESGITLGQNGNADNLGGNLGITQGSDGINVETDQFAGNEMAYAELDSDASSAEMPFVMQQLEQRFNKSAVHDSKASADESTQSYLALDIHHLESEIDAVKAWTKSLEWENRTKTTTLAEAESFREKIQNLTGAVEEKNSKLAELKRNAIEMAQETVHMRAQLQGHQHANEQLTTDVAALEKSLSEKNHQFSYPIISQASISGLQNNLTTQKSLAAALATENHRLNQAQASNAEALKRSDEETKLLKAKLNKVEADLEESRASNARALTSERVSTGYLQVTGTTNILVDSPLSPPDGLGEQRTEPEKEIEVLKDKLTELKWNALDYVIDLDFANKGFRVFNCKHYRNRDIPDGQNSSRQPTAGRIATKIFNEWREDEQFIQIYTSRRQKLLSHHRAHERVKEGQRIYPWFLKTELIALDVARGVESNYK
ncbi:hypothetical protein G6011_09024 [Alternaria panax]|uniref:Uncharacterized protein n=1 Tax=Alternaria panax TaxID=48097 RepID=A0AAD4IAB3_9PLEO|nr:hypothetical protein G6011_09024 [Alternaria panax]